MESEQIRLSSVPYELAQLGHNVSYQRLWRAATEGRIPTTRRGTHWLVDRADLTVIAEAFAPKGGAK